MATVTVHTPVEGFEGEVAGVQFEKGRAEVERDSAAFRYFQSSGYRIEGQDEPDPEPEPPDPREIGTDGDGIVVVGTKLRDAAVDPQPTDFLPPTNAGVENPHGPLVVSPELHGTGTGPIAPGAVSQDPRAQEAKETDLAAAVFIEQHPVQEATAAVPDDVPRGTEDAADPANDGEQVADDTERDETAEDEQDDEPASTDVTYSASSLDQLRGELRRRRLPTSGNKDALIERLERNDQASGQPARITHDLDEEGRT